MAYICIQLRKLTRTLSLSVRVLASSPSMDSIKSTITQEQIKTCFHGQVKPDGTILKIHHKKSSLEKKTLGIIVAIKLILLLKGKKSFKFDSHFTVSKGKN